MQEMTETQRELSSKPIWRDYDEISENFDLALSSEVIGWFNERNSDVKTAKRALMRSELDEYELSML
ncbi:MAG: hypothetical protein ACU83V_07270 [Gammaproteobacteria bacterium]